MSSIRRRGWILLSLLIVIPGCVNGVSWLPDSSGFVFTTDSGKLVVYDVKTKATRVLVEDTKSSTYWPAVSPDGGRIAVARLRFDDLKSHLQVVVYDLKGKVVHESKSIAWGRSDQKPDDDMNTTTQLFWDPAGNKLLIYGSIHTRYGTTGIYDMNSGATTLFERTVPSVYGVTPIRPDGKGFVLAKLSNKGEKLEELMWVDWQGKVKPVRAAFELKNDDQQTQLVWPVLRWSAWDGNMAIATTPAGRTRIDTVKAQAIRHEPDLVTAKLPALQLYQLSIVAPKPPEGTFDKLASDRGHTLFSGKADCARCHVHPLFMEPGWPMHTAAEIGIDDFQAKRSPDERYRTAPLRGLWTHTKGGFYHDGRFATIPDVINHYNAHFKLGLTQPEINDLAEYLKSV